MIYAHVYYTYVLSTSGMFTHIQLTLYWKSRGRCVGRSGRCDEGSSAKIISEDIDYIPINKHSYSSSFLPIILRTSVPALIISISPSYPTYMLRRWKGHTIHSGISWIAVPLTPRGGISALIVIKNGKSRFYKRGFVRYYQRYTSGMRVLQITPEKTLQIKGMNTSRENYFNMYSIL